MKKFLKILLIFILIIIGTILYSRYVGTSGLITKEYKIESQNLDDSFDGLKIVQFSDLHYLRVVDDNHVKKIVNEINLIKPDIVFFTGDLIDKDSIMTDEEIQKLTENLKNIESKYGKYATIGNHDYIRDNKEYIDIYNNSNFKLLKNEYDIIYGNNNDKIFIGGTGTYSYNEADIDKVMGYFSEGENINYKIVLVHEPDYADTIISKYDVDLILSGHSHNGQVNIPFIKELFLPYGSRKYFDNYYKLNDTDLYVSSGIGESRINFRLFNRPSINFYRINKKETNA